jgi:hypothetical protein
MKKYYTPILQGKKLGTGEHRDILGNIPTFTVNGSTCDDYGESIKRASQHVSIRDKTAEIIRVDEFEE